MIKDNLLILLSWILISEYVHQAKNELYALKRSQEKDASLVLFMFSYRMKL